MMVWAVWAAPSFQRRLELEMCKICDDTGWITVSLASAENGPTADPRDEIAVEPCDCPLGYVAWLKDAEENDRQNREFFASIGL